MSTTRFDTTIEALKGGAEKMDTAHAVKNIEGWEEYLGKHDHEGVKAVVTDLGKFKKLLHGESPDGEAIHKLLQKLGKDTTKVAGEDTTANAKKIKELGEALSSGK